MKPPAVRPWTGSPYRRRRILWTLSLLAVASIYYLTQHGAPALLSLAPSLKDMGLGFTPGSSRAGRVAQAKATADVQEIDALVHFLTAYSERKFDEDGESFRVEGMGGVVVDPADPVDLRVYAPDGKHDWAEYSKQVGEQYPLVVFSKTYCP